MSAIGPGDWVECVSVDSENDYGLRVGAIYQVERVATGRTLAGIITTGLLLHGMNYTGWTGARVGYLPERFRPLYRPKADLIERLMQPIDEPVKETA